MDLRIQFTCMNLLNHFFSFLEMTLMLRERTNDLQEQIEAAKEQLSAESEELKIMIR